MALGLSDIKGILDHWAVWREMRENAAKVPDLEARIAALEERLNKAPGQACPSCGALEFRTEKTEPHATLGDLGAKNRHLKCAACGYSEVKLETPK